MGSVSMLACCTVCFTIPCTTILSGSAGAGPNAVLAITSHHMCSFQGYRFWEFISSYTVSSFQVEVHVFRQSVLHYYSVRWRVEPVALWRSRRRMKTHEDAWRWEDREEEEREQEGAPEQEREEARELRHSWCVLLAPKPITGHGWASPTRKECGSYKYHRSTCA